MPGVVHCQAFLQIMRYACVVVHAGGDITQNVDVVEMRSRHKHRVLKSWGAQSDNGLNPSFACGGSPRAMELQKVSTEK